MTILICAQILFYNLSNFFYHVSSLCPGQCNVLSSEKLTFQIVLEAAVFLPQEGVTPVPQLGTIS